jgi:glutamine amidotransferase
MPDRSSVRIERMERLNKVSVVDYGVGNVGALLNMFDYLGVEAETVSDAGGIRDASRLVLPGVGAFDRAMQTLIDRGLTEPLRAAVIDRKVPVLGVCLGMQLLARRSEEGTLPGLGWVPADVVRIKVSADSGLKVPHIGWSTVFPNDESHLFAEAVERGEPARFYFDHGYHVVCDDERDVAATFHYGRDLCCAVERGHVAGVQFHPEKSHRHGMRLLSAWARRTEEAG